MALPTLSTRGPLDYGVTCHYCPYVIQGTYEEDGMEEPQATDVVVEDLVEDISIDGMCGVY